jgi:phosphatidylserine/phosphatidylglycerophosphate/cardiolipin synthase-like enzyme
MHIPPCSLLLASIAACAVLCTAFGVRAEAQPLPSTEATVSVCFTPAQTCVGEIVQAIDNAHTEVLVQAYTFTSHEIFPALVRAYGRGVNVEVLLDRTATAAATYLDSQGIPVDVDPAPGIAHEKSMIIDRALVIAGSYNWTRAAEHRNSEDVTFIASPAVAGWFAENWNRRRAVSAPVGGQ